jgi:hypothetical protein
VSKANKSVTVVSDAPTTLKASKRQKPIAVTNVTPTQQPPQDQPKARQENKAPKVGGKKNRAQKDAKEKVAPELNTRTHVGGVAFTNARPGVIAVMIAELSKGSSDAPVSKESIMETLIQTFKDREPAKMKATLMMQVPSGLRIEKRIIVRKSEDKSKPGYWIDAQATAAAQAEWKAQTGK